MQKVIEWVIKSFDMPRLAAIFAFYGLPNADEPNWHATNKPKHLGNMFEKFEKDINI